MKAALSRFSLATAILGVGGFLAMGAAQADIINIGLGTNGGSITNVQMVPGSAAYSCSAYTTPCSSSFAPYDSISVSGIGNPPLPFPALLYSNTIDVGTSSKTNTMLDVYVTESGITTATGLQNFLSSFTENTITGGWSVTESTYLSSSDTVPTSYGDLAGMTQLGSHAFTNIGIDIPASMVANAGSGPYSITALYVITPNGKAGSDNSTINVAVPEPGSLALFGAGLLGCALFARRRRHSQQFRA